MKVFSSKGWKNWVSILVILLAVFIIYSLVSDTQEHAAYEKYCGNLSQIKNDAKTIDYKELDKNANKFNGTVVKFTGQVLQIQEDGSGGVMRLGVTKDTFGWSVSDVIWVDYKNNTDALNEDVVTVYGVLTGSQSYTSQAHFEITIPSVVACVIEKVPKTISN